ncbi:hypothetical protein HYV10_00450 [Candidatus Dependentiae bacterium]|nr:hypothetical protein [Candidatus Dependentiae bacterium]
MNKKILIIAICIGSSIFSKNLFMGLVEDSSVNKNNFLCPLALYASGNVVCNDMDAGMKGFDISEGRTIQIFNNQQYWLQQKVEREHLLIVRGYKGDRLSGTMTSEGWDHMGAFSIIISTDPIMNQAIEPDMVAAKEQTKVIAQLWYSSSTGLQLWAQDIMILNKGQNFTIFVSSGISRAFENNPSISQNEGFASYFAVTGDLNNSLASQRKIPLETKANFAQKTPTTLHNFKSLFLKDVGFAPNYIDKSVYNAALGSPRNIKIQLQ